MTKEKTEKIYVIEIAFGVMMRGPCMNCGVPNCFRQNYGGCFSCRSCGQVYVATWLLDEAQVGGSLTKYTKRKAGG